jgi:hypothetical protein
MVHLKSASDKPDFGFAHVRPTNTYETITILWIRLVNIADYLLSRMKVRRFHSARAWLFDKDAAFELYSRRPGAWPVQ